MHVDRFPIVFYRFFIVFFAPGWARHRFSHDLPLNGLSFFFRFFFSRGMTGIVFLSFFCRFFIVFLGVWGISVRLFSVFRHTP